MSETSRVRAPVSFPRITLYSVVGTALIAAAYLLISDPDQKVVFSDLAGPIVGCLASASLFMAAKNSAGRSNRFGRAWATIGLAVLLHAIGDISWAIIELGLKQSPFPSIADGFYLVYYPVFVVGVILLSNRPASAAEKLNWSLDLVTMMAVAILGFWNFLIGPIMASASSTPLLEQVILLAYPVGDLVLLGAFLVIIYSEAEELDFTALSLLAAGILVTIYADALYSYQTIQGAYISGGLLDLAWIGANVLIGLAGASQWAAGRDVHSLALQRENRLVESPAVRRFRAQLGAVKTYLPYVWLVGGLILLIMSGLTPFPMSFSTLALGVGAIMVLVLARQLVTLLENSRLKVLVQNQAELERVNRALTAEIVERNRIQEQLAYDALHDEMTGLPNRALYLDRLGQAIERSGRHPDRKFAVLFMDLDDFKVVNDSLGHFSGDQLLILISKRLNETLRSIDTVARFGGDEFAVLLDELADERSAVMLAERIQTAMGLPFMVKEREVHVSASIGIVTDVSTYERPEDLLRDADLALYQAKALGPGRSEIFEVKLRDRAFARMELESELRRALERREFQLHYQPIVSMESDQIVGFEALVRWLHPAKGLLPPGDFLPTAEASGLILPIGEWVLNQACLQLSTWQRQYPQLKNLSMSVNLSEKQLTQPDLADRVATALKTSGLDGQSLRLEITERVLVGNYARANRVIARLRDMGIQLQIDDFGTGNSALAYLQQFPLDAIKIDRSFVIDMNTDQKSRALVRAIVTMARELGMESIGEGIETTEQLNDLKGLSCGFGQGYLLARPMDAAAAEHALEKAMSAGTRPDLLPAK